TYRIRFADWYERDLDSAKRRTFLALDTLAAARGQRARLYAYVQSLRDKRQTGGERAGQRSKMFYDTSRVRHGGRHGFELPFTVGYDALDSARVRDQIELDLQDLATFDSAFISARRRLHANNRGVSYLIDLAEPGSYGRRPEIGDRRMPTRAEQRGRPHSET